MSQRDDQVFQLSLTEIAFTITFLLLLLLGYLVIKEQSERQAAEAALARLQSDSQVTRALQEAKAQLAAAGSGNLDDVITKLVDAEQLRQERDQLQQRVADLDTKLTALTELKELLEQAAASQRRDIAQEEVLNALALQDQVREAVEQAYDSQPASGATPANKAARNGQALEAVRQALATANEFRQQLKKQLDRDLPVGMERQTVQEMVTAAKGYVAITTSGQSPESIKKENSDLRGQVAFLKNRLDARGGRDYPPCWADENGKVEFLFAVEVRPGSVAVAPAWPARREESARALPDLAAALAGPHSNPDFVSRIQGVFNWSKSQDPECRHYVQLKSTISEAVQSDRARLMVENYFYKVEVRR